MDLFPQKQIDIDYLATGLYMIPVKIQYCHHLTTSFSAHKALDKAYEATSDLKDEIIEKVIGYLGGKRFKKLDLKPVSGFSESMLLDVCKEIILFGSTIIEFAKRNNMPDIENLGQSYSGIGARLNYLLTLS